MAVTNEFVHHLSMAACEWFLMFLMFVDAALGFILTKFAHHCELESPCLYCFRFDRVFGYEKPDYYLSHFCDKHQAEVSCLISCGLHHKLSDVREMCDDCFMSIMKHKHGFPKPYLNKNLARAPSSSGSCSCCERQWKPKPKSQIKLRVPKAIMQPPLPVITGRAGRYRRRDYFKKARDKVLGNTAPFHVGNKIKVVDADMDALSDSGCADLRFSSCSGSESDDSFYEIECENEGFVNDSCVIIHKVERAKGVSDIEPLLLKGARNESSTGLPSSTSTGLIRLDMKENGARNESITGPPSLTSTGLIRHDVMENGARNESITGPGSLTSAGLIRQDMKENGARNEGITGPLSLTSPGSIRHDMKENGPEEDDSETGSLTQDLHSVHDQDLHSVHDQEEYASPGAHSVSEIEKLKQQMEHDQEQLRLLHMELEEERNAASIAADEAMAMITRLQEEKAALHMEALQYLRMMDEQAEYDMEALDKANDLVTEKDKEIQDLEAELEFFRNRYNDDMFKGTENHTGNGKTDFIASSDSKSMNQHPVLDLEDEKQYID